ncbi:MAG: sulfite exporter TauE/SafE family protein [Candidatus Pacebacteria bacterium]|nr:sulfite exporter TauE/SafE family protein [Candidatus Paceibacterota bacterium]
MEFFLFLIIGLLVGYIGGYAGIGGAPFLVGLLVLFLGVSQFEAQGTVLAMMMGPMSLLGVMTMRKEIFAQWKSIVVGVLSYAFFSYFGAELAFSIGESLIQIYFAILLIIIALLQFIPSDFFKNDIQQVESIHPLWMFIIGSVTGIIGGLFGIGAGVLMIPVFMSIFHLKKEYARALSLAILLPPVSLGAFIKYYQEGVVDWSIAVILFIAYFVANYFGAKQGSKASTGIFKIVYGVLLIITAVIYFFS